MVFEDSTRIRWRNARWLAIAIGVFALALFLDVLASLIIMPLLPKVAVGGGQPGTMDVVASQEPETAPVERQGGSTPGTPDRLTAPSTPMRNITQQPWLRTAFVVQDDPWSVSDLRHKGAVLDLVFPDYLSCTSADGQIVERVEPETATILAKEGVTVFPRLANVDADGVWQGDMLSELLGDYESSATLTRNIVASLEHMHARGVNIDFEGLQKRSGERYLDWLTDLASELHKRGMLLSVDVPVNDDAFDYEMIGKIADLVVAMVYDEHYASGRPGAVASMEWFTDAVDQLTHRVPPNKLLVGIGAYGYDWNLTSKRPATSLSFTDAMLLADTTGAEIETHAQTLNSSFHYKDSNNSQHEVWLLDAVSAWNQYHVIAGQKCRGISLWRMGQEEPAIWRFFGGDATHPFNPMDLARISCASGVCFLGEGEVLQVRQTPVSGKRNITLDGQTIDYANYDKLPTCYEVQRSGHAAAKRLALTFDDGPDPKWTPQVLKLLDEQHVHATFFVLGQQAQMNPDLVTSEWKSGHMIGSHTYSHPNIGEISDARLRMELNLTQRLLESILGHHTLLFRAPYDTDTTPQTADQLRPLYTVSNLGYEIVGADIDSEDYLRPGASQVVDNVLKALDGGANIVVFHDAGGDRAQTVEALKVLIPRLKAMGYDLVTVNQLLGLSRSQLMPKIPLRERMFTLGQRLWTWLETTGWLILKVVFFASTGIAAARILLLGYLVFKRRRPAVGAPDFTPPVTVLIPAYNEGKVIGRTITSLLASDYPELSILVIDDGSTDDTAKVAEALALKHPQVRVITKENGGKASALNLGFEEAKEEYIITIDADTIIGPQTVRALVAPFADPSVDAVCGNVQVGNVKNILTAMQDVEYVTSQNYDRRAFDTLNCISVVPGATGAWKRSMVLEVGGYSVDTLTEDADLTLAMLRAGAKIVYAPEARSITEAPESARSLFKQRFRWSFGTFQCLWKHRSALCHGSLGWVALPNMLVFQIIFPLLSPIGDLVLLMSILRGQFAAVLAGYLMFLSMDLIGSGVAFYLDHRRLTGLWTVLVQRFFYRQFMYAVAIRSLLAAIKGKRYGWNKLQRHGSVVAQAATV